MVDNYQDAPPLSEYHELDRKTFLTCRANLIKLLSVILAIEFWFAWWFYVVINGSVYLLWALLVYGYIILRRKYTEQFPGMVILHTPVLAGIGLNQITFQDIKRMINTNLL